jgi:hypothetical protein
MGELPRVSALTRERIALEFDDRGPEACMAEITRDLYENNPELLGIARRCAADTANAEKALLGFGMFYRVLASEWPTSAGVTLSPLPRVTADTLDALVEEIDEQGSETFTMESLDVLERSNPELLAMAHTLASAHREYLGIMQGFALVYRSLALQSAADRARLN